MKRVLAVQNVCETFRSKVQMSKARARRIFILLRPHLDSAKRRFPEKRNKTRIVLAIFLSIFIIILELRSFCVELLWQNLKPRTFKNRPIWSHWTSTSHGSLIHFRKKLFLATFRRCLYSI